MVENSDKQSKQNKQAVKMPEATQKRNKNKTPWLIIGFGVGALIALASVATGIFFLVKANWSSISNFVDGTDDEAQTTGDDTIEDDTADADTDIEITVEKASSCDDLTALAQKYSTKSDRIYEIMPETDVPANEDAGDDGGYGDEGPGYSETNVQVEGVDEQDIVKNDGTYIYYANQYDGNIYISKADPALSLSVVSTIDSEYDYFNGIYIYKNYLIGIGSEEYSVYSGGGEEVSGTELGSISNWYGSTMVEIWDISSKTHPAFVKGWMFEGYSSGSRFTEGDLYLVMNTSRYYYDSTDEISIPEYKAYGEEPEALCGCGDVLVPDDSWSSNFVEVVGLNMDDINEGIKSQVVYGLGDTIYMSKDHLYLAGTYYDYPYLEDSSFWGDLQNLILPSGAPTERAIVSKLDFNDGEVEYVADGQVPGTLLNQFSMDEYEGNLRIATTKNQWTLAETTNAVYVLNEDLERVGSVTGLAQGESIYAVRFIKDRGYVVTFEQVDPLFVLDLADPASPSVLGELEIPGFSDYLHPWGDHYLIGFGMDAGERNGWVQTDGLKIGLFDVEDPANPREVSNIEIGGSGSSSEILYNHRALLANPGEGWFAIPVYEYAAEGGVVEYGPGEVPAWDVTEFQGLYVFTVDEEVGEIALKGKITHHIEADYAACTGDGYSEACWYNRHYERDIQRGLFIGNVVYAVSYESIGAYKFSDLSQVAKKPFGIEVYDYGEYTE